MRGALSVNWIKKVINAIVSLSLISWMTMSVLFL